MKRKAWSFFLALLVALTLLVTPALAAEYGVIYDESDRLWSEELEALATETLPAFTETYDIDLRVDVLTTIGSFSTLDEAAEYIYDEYGYGGEYGRNGASLSLLVHEDETGVALDAWTLYFGGESEELRLHGPWNIPFEVSEEYLTADAWSGDEVQDAQALALALAGIVDGLEHFVLAGGVATTIWSPVDGPVNQATQPEPVEPVEPPAPVTTPVDPGTTATYVMDLAGILTAEELAALNAQAQDTSEYYGFGVYAMVVDDFWDYADSSDIFYAAIELYNTCSLGMGPEREGVFLLLSMEDRDFSLITNGDFGNVIFNDETRALMTEEFLDDFAYDNWYAGLSDYLAVSDYLLNDAPDRIHSQIVLRFVLIFVIALIVAFIVILILGRKMKSVAKATQASAYVVGDLHLTDNRDIYTHTTETRRKRKESSGGKVGRSGGFSGTSGKF